MLTALKKDCATSVRAAAIVEEFHLPVVLIVQTICEKKDCTKKKKRLKNKQTKKPIKIKEEFVKTKKKRLYKKR